MSFIASSSSSSSCPTFKVSLIGAENVGKTAFLKRWETGGFEKDYLPTTKASVVPLDFSTNKGEIRLDVWDCAGNPKLAGSEDEYWTNSQAIFLMFDLTSAASFENMKKKFGEANWLLEHSNPAMVLCGNKSDLKKREITASQIVNWKSENGLDYYDISAKSNYNFERPWLNLLRKLTKDSSLRFAENPE